MATGAVQFKAGLYANYAALATKDPGTLYFITDTKQIFVGDDAYTPIVLKGSGAPSAAQAEGTIYVDYTNRALYVYYNSAWLKVGDESAIETVVSYIPSGTNSTDNTLVNQEMLEEAIADLEGAMHFVGVAPHTEGNTDAQDIAAYMTSLGHTPAAGDVVVCAGSSKEYIYSDNAWREIGDEGTYVTKTTQIAGIAINNGISATALRTALGISEGANKVEIDTTGTTPTYAISIDGTATGAYAIGAAERTKWDGKQDALVFNTAYDATTNKVATMSDIAGEAVTVATTDGEIKIGGSSIAGDYKYAVTAAEKTAWNGKQDALSFMTAYDATTNKVATASDIADATVAVSTTNGEISVGGATVPGDYKFAVTAAEKTAWNGKQDALVFNTAYDATNNKVATMADISSAGLTWGTF